MTEHTTRRASWLTAWTPGAARAAYHGTVVEDWAGRFTRRVVTCAHDHGSIDAAITCGVDLLRRLAST